MVTTAYVLGRSRHGRASGHIFTKLTSKFTQKLKKNTQSTHAGFVTIFFSIVMLFTETITHFTACYWRNLQREPQNDLSLGKNPGEICKSYLPGFASNLRASKHLPCFKFCLSGTSLGWKGLYGHNFLRLKSHCYSNFSGKISKNWSCA